MSPAPFPSSQRATRLAPTPSGALHLGNARTFLVTWALARNEGWRLIMRLEDLDAGRVREGAHEQALADIGWLGIDWDGEPEVQSRDLAPYRAAVEQLASQGLLFACHHTRSEIRLAAAAPHAEDGETRYPPTLRPSPPWPMQVEQWEANLRLRLDPAREEVHDELLGEHSYDPGAECGDMVLWTRQGAPAYQLAVVVDDARHGISDVVRGDDLLPSAARQQVLARLLGLPSARWWHLPLVYDTAVKRLAKRHGAHSLAQLRADGARPEQVIGWCAWSLGLSDAWQPLDLSQFKLRCTAPALRHALAQATGPAVWQEALPPPPP